MSYKSTHTGAQIDAGVSAALNPDATPTLNSNNLVTSGGVAAKLSKKQDTLVFDNAPTSGSNNPVKSSGISNALAGKQNTLTFDDAPTDGSSNPVKSNGIYDALALKANAASLAPAFDSTVTYAIGDLVLYDGAVYRFTAAHTGAWDAADVEQTTLGAELTDEAQILAQIADRVYQGTNLTVKFASEISASPYNGDPWAWIKARIQAGDFTGIHVNDYIPFTTTNNTTLKACVGGINTYKDYGDTAVGNHIDFICRELWPTRKPVNPANYNNGLIPVQTITGDGTTTEFVLTKEMDGIASVTQGGEGLTGWTYNAATFTLTFDEAPAAGTITVTGTGTEYPWLASDLYLWLNSLAGQVPNGTGLNPAVVHKDYTQGGVYYYLPAALKAVIVEKRAYLPKRYSASGLLSNDNAGGWENIGKLWLPSEWEVYGGPARGGLRDYAVMGNCIQYPIFQSMANRVKKRSGSRDYWWVLSVYSGNTTSWCYVTGSGYAGYYDASYTAIAAPVCFRIS